MVSDKTVVFLPWRGEFGQMLMHYVRWVNQQLTGCDSEKVVCCRRGDEALFPLADEYYYGWDQVPDKEKKTSLLKSKDNIDYLEGLKGELVEAYGEDVDFILPPKRTNVDPECSFKPSPKTVMDCPNIDVLVCPRYREHGKHRNYQHWEEVVHKLQDQGLTVALAGMRQTSVDVHSVPEYLKSWNYDSLDSVLHMMNASKLVLATDAGLAHLAVLNGSSLRVIYDKQGVEAGKPEWPWALPHMKKYATAECQPILNGWNNPSVVVEAVNSFLGAETAIVKKRKGDSARSKRPTVAVCTMVYLYQKRYWWQLSSLLHQLPWKGNPVPDIAAYADISARDPYYGWNDALFKHFHSSKQLEDGHSFFHHQYKWPAVSPESRDPYGKRGHIRSRNIRRILDDGLADWILFNDGDMLYSPTFFSRLMTMVDPSETRVYAAPRWTMSFEDGYRIVDSCDYVGPIDNPVDKMFEAMESKTWQSARGRISGAGFFQLVSVEGLREKIKEDPGFVDYVPQSYGKDHNTLDEEQTHITRSDKKFRDRLGGIVPLPDASEQYHINHYRRDHKEFDPDVQH